MAATNNLYIDQGSDYAAIVSVKATNGSPLDLTGYTVKSQMRKSYSSTTVVDFVATIYDAIQGQVKLSMPANTSTGIAAGRWVYDVEITQTSTGLRRRVVEGIVTVIPQVTLT